MVSSLRGKTTTRSLYLTGVGVARICAFVSFWPQKKQLLDAASAACCRPRASGAICVRGGVCGVATPPALRRPETARAVAAAGFVAAGASIDQAIEGISTRSRIAGGMLCILGVHHAASARCCRNYLDIMRRNSGQTWLRRPVGYISLGDRAGKACARALCTIIQEAN